MQQLYIPLERLKELKADKRAIGKIEAAAHCKISIEQNEFLQLDGDAYAELVARNMLHAYGRGFALDDVLTLAGDDYYVAAIDLKQYFNTENRIKQIKARIIGKDGKTRNYIESVSTAKLSIFGNTIGIIGSSNAVHEAETALYTLIEGGNHRKAYTKMEAMHRKNKSALIPA